MGISRVRDGRGSGFKETGIKEKEGGGAGRGSGQIAPGTMEAMRAAASSLLGDDLAMS